MCQTCCLIVLFLHDWKLCRDVLQHRYLISCTVSEMCSTWVLDILWTCVLMCSHIILGVSRSSSWSMCPSSSMEYGKLHLPSSKMQFAKRWETGSELSPPNPPKKNFESLKPDCIMYAADSKFDICGRNTTLAVHNKHLISISNLVMRLKFTVYLPDHGLSGLMLLCR